MTCVIGYVAKDGIYMGCDSQGTDDYLNKFHILEEKIFTKGEFIFGGAGCYRMIQLLKHSFTPPKKPSRMSVDKYICTLFIDALRKCLKEAGYSKIEDNTESAENGYFLVGYKNSLYTVYGNFQAERYKTPYCSIGCGGELANGAMDVLLLETKIKKPEKILKRALLTASKFSAGVGKPFVVKKLEKK
jgi:20S proteasome alpha/beta subunit